MISIYKLSEIAVSDPRCHLQRPWLEAYTAQLSAVKLGDLRMIHYTYQRRIASLLDNSCCLVIPRHIQNKACEFRTLSFSCHETHGCDDASGLTTSLLFSIGCGSLCSDGLGEVAGMLQNLVSIGHFAGCWFLLSYSTDEYLYFVSGTGCISRLPRLQSVLMIVPPLRYLRRYYGPLVSYC